MGFARRSHFEPGACAIGVIESETGETSETAITGTVI